MRTSWDSGVLKPWMGWGLACVLVFPWVAGAVTNEWTGAGENGLWSNAENWLHNEVPGEGSVVVFGNAAGNRTHDILVDGLYTNLGQIRFSGEGDRRFNLRADPETAEVALGLSYTTGVLLEEGLSHDVLFDVPFGPPHRIPGNVWYLRNDSDRRVTWGDLTWDEGSTNRENPRFIEGRHALAGSYSSARNRIYLAMDELAFLPGFVPLVSPVRLLREGATLLVATDATLNREFDHAYSGGAFYIKAMDAGSEDRTFTLARNLGYLTGRLDPKMVVLENDEQDTGRFLVRLTGSGAYGEHTLPIDTRAHTVIEFRPSVVASMTSLGDADQPAMVISGEGSLWKSNTGTLNVYSENTYTGRTMISEGTLKLGTATFGEGEEARTFTGRLPAATVVELGAGAVFNLNGIDQTVGGLTGWRGLDLDAAEPTFGTVALSNATLTVDARVDSEFAGVMEGQGALVKAGPETFVLAGGYTNTAGRTLRIEEGLLMVAGILSVDEGAFELAGGRVQADTLDARNDWDVTLRASHVGITLVDVDGQAYIENGTLTVTTGEDYTPAFGDTFTLLYAGQGIEGASIEDGMFQYRHGDEIPIQDSPLWFEITYAPGSGSISLEVIPEPGVLALLALAGALLLRRQYRARR